MKKYLALLLCLLLMLSAAGCLEKTEKAEADAKPAATDTTGGDVDASETDELPAFTLGDFTVTVGEVRSSYNTVVEYMSYYGLTAPTTAEEIQQYRSMIIEDLLTAKVLPWKAQQMGIELSEEKKVEVAREVEELIVEYAGDYLEDAKSELGEDAGAAELALKAREILEQEVADYFGYPFSQWLEELTASYEENALTEMLQELPESSSILPCESEALLAGIVLDTKNFTLRTGERTFDAAAWLRRSGAETGDVKRLFQADLDHALAKYRILEQVRVYREIAVAAPKEAQDRVVAAMAADELLNIAGVKASIVLAPDGRGNCFASARSIGEVNVQLIMEKLGGGGNRNAAAMQMPNTAPEDALKKVYSAIDDYLQ